MLSVLKKMPMLLASMLVGALAIPLDVVPGETVALWNFNEAAGPTVADQVSEGGAINGTMSANVQIVTGSVFGSGFGNARNFSVQGSAISLGGISGTKLDLTNRTEAAVEAMVYRTGDTNGPTIIFDNRELQLQVIENKLAGFVRQSSGFKGIVSDIVLARNTPYRVGAFLKNGHLVLALDGKIVGNVGIPEPIQSAENGATAYLGGDPSGLNFPGIIDDIRLSKVVTLDTIPPTIALQSPDLSVPVINGRPVFTFVLSDNQNQIDPTSISVLLNGQPVSGLVYNPTNGTLSGQLAVSLAAGRKNLIDVLVKDQVGNLGASQFQVSYIKAATGEEYASDSDTLGLWHFNDHGASWAKDASSFGRHGKLKGTQSVIGVLGQARLFTSYVDEVVLPPVPIPGSTFTFEAWVRPLSDQSPLMPIFDNDQIYIGRTDTKAVAVTFRTNYQVHNYKSPGGVFPTGKWSHLKVVYDGSLPKENLLILIDGMIVAAVDALPDCEFDDEPKLAKIGGSSFVGEIDEIRLSKVVRESTNLVRGFAPTIEMAYPGDLETYKTQQVSVFARIRDTVGITAANIQVKLNGIVQPLGTNLTYTAGELRGSLSSLLSRGLNELEIRVKGLSGNQTVLQRRFFYFEDGGLMENVPDSNTVGLWHLNEDGGNFFADSSGKNHPLFSEYNPSFSAPGKFGNGQFLDRQIRAENISFSGKSFTVEGWFKPKDQYGNYLWQLTGDYFSVTLHQSQGALMLEFFISGTSGFGIVIPEVMTENRFYHVAVIHDAEADSANLMVLVDGVVKYQRNVRAYCKACISPLRFFLEPNQTVDEIRISDIARKKLNVGSGIGPTIGFMDVTPNSTVHTSQPSLRVLFNDKDSIDQASMSLAVNGIIDTTLTKTVSGTTGSLSGPLSVNLQSGANEITVRAKNQLGRESVQTMTVFYITKGSRTSYSPDANTVGLWHFDSGNPIGILGDVSGRAFNWDGWASPSTGQGIFGEGLSVVNDYVSVTANASPVADATSWTFETWLKSRSTSSFYHTLDSLSFLNVGPLGDITFGFGPSETTPLGSLPQDGNFHHLAFIADAGNPYRQALVVVDGAVVGSLRSQNIPSVQFAQFSASWGDIRLDEMRLSNVPRYTLNYERPSSTLFNSLKLLKKK